MPRMTKADIQQINEAVKAGNIDVARRLLGDSDDARAPGMLAQLNAKYPPGKSVPATPRAAPSLKSAPASPSVSADPLAEAKRLIAQKDYEAAEKMLWESDDPAAGELLRKITLVKSAGGKTPSIDNPSVKVKPRAVGSNIRWAIIGILVAGVIGLAGFLVMKQKEASEKPQKVFDQLFQACLYIALNEHTESDYISSETLYKACEYMAEEFLRDYPGEAYRCYDEVGENIFLWFGCPDDRADLNMEYLVIALK